MPNTARSSVSDTELSGDIICEESDGLDRRLTSQPNDMAKQAQKMAIEKVLPKRLGVEMSTSLEQRSHLLCFMIAGLSLPQSDL